MRRGRNAAGLIWLITATKRFKCRLRACWEEKYYIQNTYLSSYHRIYRKSDERQTFCVSPKFWWGNIKGVFYEFTWLLNCLFTTALTRARTSNIEIASKRDILFNLFSGHDEIGIHPLSRAYSCTNPCLTRVTHKKTHTNSLTLYSSRTKQLV